MKATRLGHMPALDGVRAVAILLVVGYHGFVPGFGYGNHGVDVFFVLSGFLISALIAGQFQDGEFSRNRFYLRRAIRLMPALLVTVVVFTPVGLIVMKDQQTLLGAGAALLYLTPFAPTTIFDHTWTLALEEWFYLVWPLVLGKMLRDRLSLRQIALLVGIAGVTGQAFMIVQPGSLAARPSTLLLGAALAMWWLDGGRIPRPQVALLGGFGSIMLGVFAGPELWGPVPYWLTAFGTVAMIGGIACDAHGFSARVLESVPMVAIGVVSYEWYLVHSPLLKLAAELWGIESGFFIGPISLALAFGLHRALAPMQQHLRLRSSRTPGKVLPGEQSSTHD